MDVMRKYGIIDYDIFDEMKKEMIDLGITVLKRNKMIADNRDIVLEVVRKDGSALEYASQRLRDDEEVVQTAMKNDGRVLRYASERLQNKFKEMV